MSKNNVKCPICGHVNQDVDLDETEGWVECCKCEAVFMAASDNQQFCKPEPESFNLSVHTSNA